MNEKQNIKQYPKISTERNHRKPIEKVGWIYFQEKLDGSNFTIIIEKDLNGEWKKENATFWSRTRQVFPDGDEKAFNFAIREFNEKFDGSSLHFRGLTKYIKFHTELLHMAKLPYNITHKGLYLFEVIALNENKEILFSGLPNKEVEYGLKTIPLIEREIKSEAEYDYIVNGFLTKKSFVDNKTPVEGVVTKKAYSRGDLQRVKYVSDKFKEIKHVKAKNPNSYIEIKLGNPFTDARMVKHLSRLVENKLLNEEELLLPVKGVAIGKILKHSQALVEDVIEEELETYMEDVKKLIKKLAPRYVAKFLKKGGKDVQ